MFHSDCNPESELGILSDLDWQNYSGSVPYEVVFDSNEGRYLRATRDIKRGMFLWKKQRKRYFSSCLLHCKDKDEYLIQQS